MRTNATAHDTDQKQGNVMDSNPNCGTSREEKEMNAHAETTSLAALIALGLALGVQSAEPDSTMTAADLKNLEGQPVEGQKNLVWKRAEVLIEWGFKNGTQALPFDGSIEATQVAMAGKAKPLPGDAKTAMTGERAWKSPGGGGARRGIAVPVLYTAATRGPARSIVTVRTSSGSFSFMPVDLEGGPILAPEYGFFVATASSDATAAAFQKELASKNMKTIRQKVREMPEQTWEGAMEALHGKREWPAFPQVPYEPKMKVEVPCQYLTGLWRIGAWQIVKNCPRIKRTDIKKLTGHRMNEIPGKCRTADASDPEGIYLVADHPFLPLGCETDRILLALDHLGMHEVSRDGLTVWLENQQPDGALLMNTKIEKDHAVGALLLPWVYAEHYRLTGDKEWLCKQAPRLKAAADWILKRRRSSMKEHWSAQDLEMVRRGEIPHHGLQPPIPCGDGGGRPFCFKDFAAYRSVRMLADVLVEADPAMGAELAREAELYRTDLRPVIEAAIALAPVMQTLDGLYHSFHPQGFHDRGPLSRILPEKANVYSHCGPYHCDYLVSAAAMEVWLPFGLMSLNDPRVEGNFDVLEDVFFRDHPWLRKRYPNYDPNRDWFAAGWGYQSGWERLPDCYLMLDDIPNFLRSWLNRCAVDVNLRNWTFNEHTTFADNDKSHGNAVFLTNFRNMLVMEIADALWLARATPRVWLEQGRKVAVKNAPTCFGTVAYEIVSDVDNGKINATVEMPSRKAPKEVVLRFRHPKSAPIKAVTVNRMSWTEFNKGKETITLKGLSGVVAVTAQY